ncbi:MAG: TetR/AcrR family transcriptional regulator [Lachnospiraceae bacterium]|jgi:AcrR family transcriptional regulator|nr:TetR/AcrR family transcriptional regulator [Lachnospiraceae bacterium]
MKREKEKITETNKEDKRKVRIISTAARLFIEQGYESTGMRQIAKEAEVSLSLANYHFGSKRNIAMLLVRAHLRAVQAIVYSEIPDDERLRAATLLRLNYELMNREHLRKFYQDTLLNDIYMEAVSTGNVPYDEQNALSKSEKHWILSDGYIPVSIERALVICPFSDSIGESVPDYIIRNTNYCRRDALPLSHDAGWYVKESHLIAQRLLTDYPELYKIFDEIARHAHEHIKGI